MLLRNRGRGKGRGTWLPDHQAAVIAPKTKGIGKDGRRRLCEWLRYRMQAKSRVRFTATRVGGDQAAETVIAATTASMAPEAARLCPVAPLMEERGGGTGKSLRTALDSARSLSGVPVPCRLM